MNNTTLKNIETTKSVVNYLLSHFGRVNKNALLTSLRANNVPVEKIGKGYIIVDGMKVNCKVYR